MRGGGARPLFEDCHHRGVTFTFVVDREAPAATDVASTDVAPYRYHGRTWTELEAAILETQEVTIVFEAESPGLSTFAVAVADQQPTTQEPTTTVQSTAEHSPAASEQPSTRTVGEVTDSTPQVPSCSDRSPLLVVSLLVLLALGAVVYSRRRD